MTCQQVVDLVSGYLDDTLSVDERALVEEHLRICEGCVRYLDQMRDTLTLLGRVPLDSLSAEARATLLDAFRDLDR